MIFELEQYKEFIIKQLRCRAIYKKVDITDQVLEALYQFEVSPSVYLQKTIPGDSLLLKYKSMFDLKSKPYGMYINNWFLYTSGFKFCNKCKQVKSIENYGISTNALNSMACYCKKCNNYITKIWQEENKELFKTIVNTYRLNNLDAANARSAKYRAKRLEATPNWLTEEQQQQILTFYTKATSLTKETGVKHHVDHVIPLQGNNVSGLHVPWNLQILIAKDNLSKGNKIIHNDYLL